MTNGIDRPALMTSMDSLSSTYWTRLWKTRSYRASWINPPAVLKGHEELRRFFVRGTEGRQRTDPRVIASRADRIRRAVFAT